MQLSSSKIILSILLMVSSAGLADTWTDPETGRTWSYRKVGDTAEITQGQYSDWTGDLIIPDNLGDIPVTSIGRLAFSGCGNLSGALKLPNGLTSIGGSAFSQCRGLIGELIIPSGVTNISGRAFGNCSGFSGDLNLPSAVTSIGSSAFSGCSGLNGSLAIPDGVMDIGDYAFQDCLNLCGPLSIPNSVTNIGKYAFDCCSNLVGGVRIPDGVTRIAQGAFCYCSKLSGSLMLPDGLTNIGIDAFHGCSGLTGNLVIPNSVTNIGERAFSSCSGFTGALTIPEGVAFINDSSFSLCTNLTQVVIPDGVHSIGDWAFSGCHLKQAIVPDSVVNMGKYAFPYEKEFETLYVSENYTGFLGSYWNVVRYSPYITAYLDTAGGMCSLDSLMVKVSSKYGDIPSPTKVGFRFAGWRLYGKVVNSESFVLSISNHVLQAQWIPEQYQLSFDCNGGSDSAVVLNVTFDAAYGELPTPSRLGYSFEGWIFNGEKITSDTIVFTPSNHVLTASWLPNKYPMVFNANGGIGGCTLMQDYDTPVSAPVVSRVGYSFTGWSPSILTNVPAESVEFVAQWTANNYEVSFDLMGGIGEFDPLTLSYDGNYGELPVPDREGYAFQGWSLNGNMVNADTILATSSNHVLTAVWQGNEYIVSLDAKGGIVEPGTKSVVYGDEYGDLPIPVREGYDFVAWLCNGHVIESDTVVSTSSNHTFVASWDANQYQVSFDPKGGNLQGGSASKIVTYDAEYGELPEPSRVGYTFVRWMLGDDEISSMSVVTTACNHTLSAAWTANKYVVELNSNEGTLDPELSTIEVVFDSAYGALPQPERVGYGFVGCATSMIGGEIIGPDSLATTNQVLYALWEANQYQIVYDANNDSGETYAADAVYDEDVEIAENPFVWLAHVFVGWSDSPDGEVAYEPEEIVRNLTAVPDGVVTLYAMWEPLVVAVPAVSPGDGTSFIEDTCLVTITCESEGADIYYSTKGTPPRIKESYLYTEPFEIADTTQIMAVAVKEGVMSEVSVVTISRRELTIPEAAGAVELPFETGGDAEWEPTADKTSPNGLSVKSGTIGCAEYGSSNVTWLVTSVEGAGTLSFQWKVDCEHDYTGMCLWDHLVVSTNGVEVTRIDGSQDWAQVSLSFGSGSNVIRWAFVKDDEDDDSAPFEDRAWISCVTWTPAVIIEDTTYDADEMPEMVTAQPGVTLRVKVETEPTADEIAAFMARIVISPKSAEQSSDYFKVVGTYDSAIGSVVMSVAIDEEAIELNRTATEILGAVMDKSFTGGEVTIPSAKQGLWYGIVVVDDLSRLNEAAESVSFVQAGEDGVKIDITRPEGPTAFCKIVVRDEGRE